MCPLFSLLILKVSLTASQASCDGDGEHRGRKYLPSALAAFVSSPSLVLRIAGDPIVKNTGTRGRLLGLDTPLCSSPSCMA